MKDKCNLVRQVKGQLLRKPDLAGMAGDGNPRVRGTKLGGAARLLETNVLRTAPTTLEQSVTSTASPTSCMGDGRSHRRPCEFICTSQAGLHVPPDGSYRVVGKQVIQHLNVRHSRALGRVKPQRSQTAY
jgi:hypothetical protein